MRTRLNPFSLLLVLGSVLLLPESGLAQSQRPSRARIQRLWGLQWSGTLDQALARTKRTKNPVLWPRMLGDLDGYS